MKKIGLIVMAVLVTMVFASVSMAAISTSSSSGVRPCGVCSKQPCVCGNTCATCPQKAGMPCTTCASCGKSCSSCAKPMMKATCKTCGMPAPCNTCKTVSKMGYKRDVLGAKVPVYTDLRGDAHNDTAVGYESALVSGE